MSPRPVSSAPRPSRASRISGRPQSESPSATEHGVAQQAQQARKSQKPEKPDGAVPAAPAKAKATTRHGNTPRMPLDSSMRRISADDAAATGPHSSRLQYEDDSDLARRTPALIAALVVAELMAGPRSLRDLASAINGNPEQGDRFAKYIEAFLEVGAVYRAGFDGNGAALYAMQPRLGKMPNAPVQWRAAARSQRHALVLSDYRHNPRRFPEGFLTPEQLIRVGSD